LTSSPRITSGIIARKEKSIRSGISHGPSPGAISYAALLHVREKKEIDS
jgi:hypothetical protein